MGIQATFGGKTPLVGQVYYWVNIGSRIGHPQVGCCAVLLNLAVVEQNRYKIVQALGLGMTLGLFAPFGSNMGIHFGALVTREPRTKTCGFSGLVLTFFDPYP